MTRILPLLACVILVAGCARQQGNTSDGLVPIGAGLRGPTGVKATVYATGLKTMSAFAVDSKGRLWVTTSGATDHSRDGVYLVRKPGASPVKVISGLKGPLGLVWLDDRLYVASIGRVDAFGGLRGTRFSTRATILNEPSGHGWNENLVLAPNGRLVLSISSACDHCTRTSKWSGAVVSFEPDGSDVEVYARRIRAGYGLAFYPGTKTLFVSMNQRDDLGTKTPGDWLAVVREGEDWRFPACYGQGGAACAGVPAPVAELDRHAAAGGVAIVTGSLGSSVGTSAVVAEWQSGVVKRVALTKSDSGYAGTASTLLTGLQNPLPVLTLADGSVLVGDWGTGTIYRVAQA